MFVLNTPSTNSVEFLFYVLNVVGLLVAALVWQAVQLFMIRKTESCQDFQKDLSNILLKLFPLWIRQNGAILASDDV